MDSKYRQSLEQPISESIKLVSEGNYDSYELNVGENKIVINYDPEKIAVEKILRCISEANLQIKDISTKQPDLEEIFKHLIAKK